MSGGVSAGNYLLTYFPQLCKIMHHILILVHHILMCFRDMHKLSSVMPSRSGCSDFGQLLKYDKIHIWSLKGWWWSYAKFPQDSLFKTSSSCPGRLHFVNSTRAQETAENVEKHMLIRNDARFGK